jgi:type VI secretion system protein ImpE
MTADALFKAGQLADALAAQMDAVRSNPTDLDARFFLLALMVFNGEIERAETQLDAIGQMDEATAPGRAVYQSLLAGEYERRKIYREGAQPTFPPDPPATLGLRARALHALQRGDKEEAGRLLDEAMEGGVVLTGKLNGEAFDGLRDYDDVLGQIIEIFAGGRCIWMPMEQIRSLKISEPKTHLDLLWAKADLVDAAGDQATVHLPALYEGSYEHAEESIRLGRSQDWIECGEDLFRGAGQRLLLATQDDTERQVALLDVRTLEIEGASETSEG